MVKDTSELFLLRKDLIDVWRPAHDAMRAVDVLFNQKHQIRYVKPAQPRKLPSARTKLQTMIDTMVTSVPDVKRRPVSEDSEASKAKADKVEKWALAQLRLAAQHSLIPPPKVIAGNLARYGYTVWPQRFNEKAFADKDPKDIRAMMRVPQLPFDFTVPNPARVLLPHYEVTPTFAVETLTMTVRQAKETFPDLENEFHGSPLDLVQCVYYWDEDQLYVMVDGREAMDIENPFAFVPFAHAFAGYGYERTPVGDLDAPPAGKSWEGYGPSPEDLAEGLLAGAEDVIKSIDEWYTAMLAKSLKGSYLSIFTTMDPEELMRNMAEAGLGGVIPVDPNKPIKDQIQWQEPPPTSSDASLAFEVSSSQLDIATFPSTVQGVRQAGTSTATEANLQLGAGRMKFDVPMMKLNHLAGIALGNAAKMLTVMEKTMKVDGVSVSGADFENNWDFTVKYEARDEAALLRAKDIGLRELAQHAIDLETYWEDTGRSDGTAMQKRLDVQTVTQSPQALQTVLEAADIAFRKKHGLPPPALPAGAGGTNGAATEGDQPFLNQPGGPEEANQVQDQMEGVADIARAR